MIMLRVDEVKWFFLNTFVFLLLALQSYGQHEENYGQQDDLRQGRDLLDWIGLGIGPDKDPYVAKTNSECINGDLAECFKSRALSSFDEFFDKRAYHLNENVRIIRMPETQLRQIAREPYEYSEIPRSNEPEWDQLVKFALRKVEKFLKSSAIELNFDNEVTESGRYTPRFVDEIADEIDIIEDKKDSIFKRKQLKKLFIPMLIILKLFKLKLLLFLPLILGLASFKKVLAFLAIIVPGLIGFFKLCKPQLQSSFGQQNYYNTPHYSPAGIGYQPHHYKEHAYPSEYSSYYDDNRGLTFGHEPEHAQNIAYSGYSSYRNANGNNRDGNDNVESTSKKSILPDS